jgi:hypothetical protein
LDGPHPCHNPCHTRPHVVEIPIRDFALAAREHTKGITATEWDWLDAHLPLDSLGIGRFEPVFWLGGTLTLTGAQSGEVMSLPRTGFVGLPCRQLSSWCAVQSPPQRYWLVENRASFERQAAQLQPGVCLIWLPGRPSDSWLQSMHWLLSQAPAPAGISCDPDPAGIQIALTAGQLWDDAGLRWDAHQMSSEFWKDGVTCALNDYDRRVLSELQQAAFLPESLAQLRDHMMAAGLKAEQEGWI